MVDAKVAKRYARALYLISEEKNVLSLVAADLKALGQFLKGSEDLQLFIRNPIFKKEEREQLVNKVFQEAVHPQVLTFLLFLIEKNRLNLIGDISEMFNQMVLNHQNILEAKLTTEREMDQPMITELLNKLASRTGKKIQTQVTTDPQLLGGFKLQLGDTVYDASLKTQLKRFQESVLSTV